MEHSASAPSTFTVEDYAVPKQGLDKSVDGGSFFKDPYTNSSRINQIVKQAGKYPGPGTHNVGHYDYSDAKMAPPGVHAFAKTTREYKTMHKVPEPQTYENRGTDRGKTQKNRFAGPLLGETIGARSNLSNRPRVIHGKMPTAKKRSFLDAAERHGNAVPGPGYVTPKYQESKLRSPTLSRSTSVPSRAPKPPPEVGPDHYQIKKDQVEHRMPNYTWPKESGANFIEKAVRSTLLDNKSKIPQPGPGHHNSHMVDHYKTTRGTKSAQLRGIGRSPLTGYF